MGSVGESMTKYGVGRALAVRRGAGRTSWATWVAVGAALAGCGAESLDEQPLESSAQAALEWRSQAVQPSVDSPHPYTDNASIERRVEAPSGATSVRVEIRIQTEQGYDFVEFLDGERTLIHRFSGRGEGLSQEIPGRVAIVRLVSDGSVTDWGFSITGLRYQIEAGGSTPPPPPPPSGDGRWVDVPVRDVGTSNPYRNGQDERWTIAGPAGTEALRLTFDRVELESGYDFLRVLDERGTQLAEYTGKRSGFVTPAFPGSRLALRFTSDGSVTAAGFRVIKVEARVATATPPTPAPECRADADCGAGRRCRNQSCEAAAPPPPPPPAGRAGVGEACDGRTAPCAAELSCVREQNSRLGGVCARPAWSRWPLTAPQATDHPYKDRQDDEYPVVGPSWADQTRLVFSRFETERNYDWADVLVGGRSVQRLTGPLGAVESTPFDGHEAVLRFHSDDSVTAWGFELREVDVFGVPDALVAMAYEPRRCGGRIPTDEAGLTSYLAGRGVPAFGVRSYTYSTQTCSACSCGTGERTVFLVPARDVAKVTAISRYIGVFSVQANDVVHADAVTAVRATPVQCQRNPWDGAAGADARERVRAWAGSLGVNVLAAFDAPARSFVCEACSCPTLDDLVVVVPTSEAGRLAPYGFSPGE